MWEGHEVAEEESPETAPEGSSAEEGEARAAASQEPAEEGSSGPPGSEAGLAFRQGEDGSLHADFTPSVSNVAVDGDALRRMLGDAGFGEVCLFREKVAELIRRQRDSKEPFSLAIGGHRDGAVEVTIDERGAAAEAQLRHPCGDGRAIDDEMIREALTNAGVTEGWLEEEFPRLIKDQGRTLTDPVVIARGIPPTDGEDTRFESLVPDAPERKPRNLGDEVIDYREFGGVVTVAEGDPLVRRQPPTDGEPGRTVTGEPIQPRPGRNIEFKTDSTVRVAEDDPDTLVAAMGGMPVVTDAGAKVEQVVELDTVDLSTGHIDFDGTVVVKGDVAAAMRITATGDINVGGTVEAARLLADGDITVNGGILGRGNVRDENGEARTEAGYVKAGGSLHARFIQNTMVDAGDSVVAKDMLNNSEVTCNNQVVVGGKGGSGKAQIVGGFTRATTKIETSILGSPRSAHTRVEAGYDHEFHQRMRTCQDALADKEKLLADVERMLNYYRAYPEKAKQAEKAKPGLLKRLLATQKQAEEERQELEANREALEADLDHMRRARVVVRKQVYSNVTLVFGPKSRTTDEDIDEGGVFTLQDQWITFRRGKA